MVKTTTRPIKKQAPKNQEPRKKTPHNAAASTSFLPIIFVLVATFIAFLPVFENGFVNWDDDINIYDNKTISALSAENIAAIFTTHIIGNYNPLPILTFAIERAIFGTDNLAQVVHINNLLLHLGCVYLVFRVVSALGMSQWVAIVSALLFGIHPLRVESVAWATERKDVLFALFYFAAFWQYVKVLQSKHYSFRNKHLLFTLVFFILSLFSKVQAVSLPLSMLALDYYFRRPLSFTLIFEKIPFWIGSLAMGITNVLFLIQNKTIDNNTLNYTFFDRLLVGCHAYAVYLVKLFIPYEMVPLYPYPPTIPATFYLSAAVFLASAYGVYRLYKAEKRTLVFGWVFFFVNFIFVSQILGAGAGFLADRFTYVPYLGFFIILASLTEGVADKVWAKGLVGIYALACFFMTFKQVKIWKNSETLWTHAIGYYPSATVPWFNRGSYYRDQKQFDRALTDYNQAIAIKPTAEVHNSRGKLYFDLGKLPEALNDYNAAIRLDSAMTDALANRAAAFGATNQLDAALADANKALAYDPEHINALVNRGTVYEATEKHDLALADLSKVLIKDPLHENARINIIIVYQKIGQLDKALENNQVYLKQFPNDGRMWLNQAIIKRQLGQCNQAMTDFDTALRLDASIAGGVYLERAQCFAALGNKTAARQDALKAQAAGLQVDPLLLVE